MDDRKRQLHELYGLHFPEDLFTFWEWYNAQPPEIIEVFTDRLGFCLVGAFDVLAGRFDNVQLRYPAAMHWRFAKDPAEFITVVAGNEDGFHWGYWFDDPDHLPPVVAANYARDAFEFWTVGVSLFDALHEHITEVEEGIEENIEDEPEYAEDYGDDLEALEMLRAALPSRREWKERIPTHQTPEKMGIIANGSPQVIEQFLRGKELWFDGDIPEACALLEPVYRELDREPLAAIAEIIRKTPYLPHVHILSYDMGDYHSIEDALAEPEKVRKLELWKNKLTELPDISSLVNLEELRLMGNALQTLPESLTACRNLRLVHLHDNAFQVFPEVLFQLPKLERILLGKNKIGTLPLPESLPENLKEISLEGNPLSPEEGEKFQVKFPAVQIHV